MNSPFDIQNEGEDKPPPLECVPEGLVEEKSTIVSVQEEDKVNKMCD